MTGSEEIPEKALKEAGARENTTAMSTECTDLMLAARGGDRGAFDRLVGLVRRRAFFVARGLVGSREDALDLVQDAFMKVYRARDTFRDGEPFLPWFHRILRNTCYSHLRGRGRLRRVSLSAHAPGVDPDEGDWELHDPEAPTPEALVVAGEEAARFQHALTELSARDREVLALRHHQELSYREIADSLGIPQGTVMSRLYHARRRLREALGDEPELPPDGSLIQKLEDTP